jgi:hypothetical protein
LSQTDAVKPLILWESPHSVSIVRVIKEFSSLRLPKHRSVFNAFTHLTAAIVAYQINPLPPKPITASIP